MAKDKQSESSKLDQKNEAMDKAQEEGRKRFEKQEEEDNKAPRKAVGRAVGKAVDYVKKGLGIQPEKGRYEKFMGAQERASDAEAEEHRKTGMKKGGSVKSASSRADGIAIRGKTRA